MRCFLLTLKLFFNTHMRNFFYSEEDIFPTRKYCLPFAYFISVRRISIFRGRRFYMYIRKRRSFLFSNSRLSEGKCMLMPSIVICFTFSQYLQIITVIRCIPSLVRKQLHFKEFDKEISK